MTHYTPPPPPPPRTAVHVEQASPVKNGTELHQAQQTQELLWFGQRCRTLVESSLMRYPRIVRERVKMKMEMMVTQPNSMIKVERK